MILLVFSIVNSPYLRLEVNAARSFTVQFEAGDGYFIKYGARNTDTQVYYRSQNTVLGVGPYLYRDGYEFTGWRIKGGDGTTYGIKDGTNENVFSGGMVNDIIVTTNIIFEPTWVKKYYVKFILNGGKYKYSWRPDEIFTSDLSVPVGEGYKIGDFEYSAGITPLSVIPETMINDSNMTFLGWKKDGDSKLYTRYDIANMTFSSNVNFTAQWKSNQQNNTNNETRRGDRDSADTRLNQKRYSNEWVNGKWYNADGMQTYKGTLKWKSNSKGWWVEDSKGWYPKSQWQKIDGKWYYFTADGYMDWGEYRDGCWLNNDGSWDEKYSNGTWHSSSKGWWFSDGSWYASNQSLWIDGTKYHFNSSGYWDY